MAEIKRPWFTALACGALVAVFSSLPSRNTAEASASPLRVADCAVATDTVYLDYPGANEALHFVDRCGPEPLHVEVYRFTAQAQGSEAVTSQLRVAGRGLAGNFPERVAIGADRWALRQTTDDGYHWHYWYRVDGTITANITHAKLLELLAALRLGQPTSTVVAVRGGDPGQVADAQQRLESVLFTKS